MADKLEELAILNHLAGTQNLERAGALAALKDRIDNAEEVQVTSLKPAVGATAGQILKVASDGVSLEMGAPPAEADLTGYATTTSVGAKVTAYPPSKSLIPDSSFEIQGAAGALDNTEIWSTLNSWTVHDAGADLSSGGYRSGRYSAKRTFTSAAALATANFIGPGGSGTAFNARRIKVSPGDVIRVHGYCGYSGSAPTGGGIQAQVQIRSAAGTTVQESHSGAASGNGAGNSAAVAVTPAALSSGRLVTEFEYTCTVVPETASYALVGIRTTAATTPDSTTYYIDDLTVTVLPKVDELPAIPASKLTVGAGATFEAGYDPTAKANSTDLTSLQDEVPELIVARPPTVALPSGPLTGRAKRIRAPLLYSDDVAALLRKPTSTFEGDTAELYETDTLLFINNDGTTMADADDQAAFDLLEEDGWLVVPTTAASISAMSTSDLNALVANKTVFQSYTAGLLGTKLKAITSPLFTMRHQDWNATSLDLTGDEQSVAAQTQMNIVDGSFGVSTGNQVLFAGNVSINASEAVSGTGLGASAVIVARTLSDATAGNADDGVCIFYYPQGSNLYTSGTAAGMRFGFGGFDIMLRSTNLTNASRRLFLNCVRKTGGITTLTDLYA